jgi:hypothetical protein
MHTTDESRSVKWTAAEKKAARAAFDLALARELAAMRKRIEALLQESPEPEQVWKVLDYLSEKQRDMEWKYDYRYSVLTGVLGRLLGEGLLSEAELGSIGPEKRKIIERHAAYFRESGA